MTSPSVAARCSRATCSSSQLTHLCKRRPGQMPTIENSSVAAMLHGRIQLALWHDLHSGRSTFRHRAGQTDKPSDFYIYRVAQKK